MSNKARQIAAIVKGQNDPDLQPESKRLPVKFIAGKRSLPAVCPRCRTSIQRGQWIRQVARSTVLEHAFPCGGGR